MCVTIKICSAQEFDVDNKEGAAALERVYRDIIGETTGPMPNVEVSCKRELARGGKFRNKCHVSRLIAAGSTQQSIAEKTQNR